MKRVRRSSAAICLVVLMLSTASVAADWTGPATQLARAIARITGPSSATLMLWNISSLRPEDVPDIERELTSQLRAADVRVVSAGASADILVTLSENAQGFVWVAEVQQGSETRTVILPVPRADLATGPISISVRKTLLWSQALPILDAAPLGSSFADGMLILDPEAVTVYRRSGTNWQAQQSLSIPRDRPWPRDVRGRLWTQSSSEPRFRAFLPGVSCTSGGPSPLSLACAAADDPWPLSSTQYAFFVPARNYFSGVVSPRIGNTNDLPPFYSAVSLQQGRNTVWLLAQVDGAVLAINGSNKVAIEEGWGSDMAAVNSGCGSGEQLLVTSGGDSQSEDSIQAVELSGAKATPVGAPVAFNGPITALWAGAERRSAVAVAHDLFTGRYDAYELAITCAQ